MGRARVGSGQFYALPRRLRHCHPAETAVADEGCGYSDEGEEVFGLALVPAVESPAAGQPGHRSLDHLRCRTSRCEDSVALRPMRWGMPRLRSRRAGGCSRSPYPCAASPAVGAGAAARVDGGMPPASGSRLWPSCMFAPEMRQSVAVIDQVDLRGRPQTGHAYRAPRPVRLSPRSEFVKDHAVEPRPDLVLAQLGKPAVDRGPGGAQDRRQLPPRATRRRHEDDRRRDFAVTRPTWATTLRAYHHRWRHHPPEQHPRLVRRQAAEDGSEQSASMAFTASCRSGARRTGLIDGRAPAVALTAGAAAGRSHSIPGPSL